MERTEVKINEWLIEGFTVYKDNFGTLLVAALLTFLLSILTLGVLAGPMAAGLAMMAMKLYDKTGEAVQVGDVFQGFSFFRDAFLFVLVWGLGVVIVAAFFGRILILGQLVTAVVYIGVSSVVMFGPYLIVDQHLDFRAASFRSIEMVRTNIWPFIAFGALAVVLGQIGVLACVIGVALTLPLQFCMIAVAYREVFCGVVTEPAVKPDEPDDAQVGAAAASRVLSGEEIPDEQESGDTPGVFHVDVDELDES